MWKKLLAGLLCLAFLFPCLAWAFAADAYPATFPRRLGTITHDFRSSQRLVVCVQDLHCNYEVQKNIAEIMHVLARDYGLKLVALEGASRALNVTKLADFPLETIKKQTADYLMRQGKITGPEFYAATGKYPVRLEGIEDQKLYAANREALKKFFNDENLGLVTDVREALQGLKARVYSPALKSLDARKTAYRRGKLALLPYCLYLAGLAKQKRMDLKNVPAFLTYVSRGQAGPETMDPDRLAGELEKLEGALRAALYQDDDQRRLDELERRLDVMEKLLSISATPDEVGEFRARPWNFALNMFADFIRRFQSADDSAWLPEIEKLDAALQEVLGFYQVADRRSEAFVRNTLRRMERQRTDVALLVAGGYHTGDIVRILERQGVSCLCIQPRLTQPDRVNPYFSLLRNRRTPLEKLLSRNQKTLALVPSSPETDPDQAQVRLRPDQLSAVQRIHYTQVEMFHKLGVVADWAQTARDRTVSGLKGFYARWQQAGAWDDHLIQPDLDSVQDLGQGYSLNFSSHDLAAVYQHRTGLRTRVTGALADLNLQRFAVAVIQGRRLAEVRKLLANRARPSWHDQARTWINRLASLQLSAMTFRNVGLSLRFGKDIAGRRHQKLLNHSAILLIGLLFAGMVSDADPEAKAIRGTAGTFWTNVLGSLIRIPWALQYYIYGLFDEALRRDLQGLHPEWEKFDSLVEKLHAEYGRTEAGYFNYERGLHTAWLAWQYGRQQGLAPQALRELTAAALLERFDLQQPYLPLDLTSTMDLLDNGVGLAQALSTAEMDASRIKLLLQGSAYPWGEEQALAWERALGSLSGSEAAVLGQQAEILRFANQAITYVIHNPQVAWGRVLELHRDKPDALNPEQMFAETNEFLTQLQSEMDQQNRLAVLPGWMQKNWQDNRAYFAQDFNTAMTLPLGVWLQVQQAFQSWQERLSREYAARAPALQRLINLAPWPAMLGAARLLPIRPHVPASLLAHLPVMLRPLLQNPSTKLQYWAYRLMYTAIKSAFRGLHPEWDQYAKALTGLRGQSGREWTGYHRFEHGLEVAFTAWIYGRGQGYSREQLLHLVAAASLHDLDIRPEYKSPKVANTLNYLDPGQWDEMKLDSDTREKLRAILEALQAMNIDLQIVRTLIRRTDFPWSEAAQKAYAEDLGRVDDSQRAWVAAAAEALQFMDKASGYIFLDPHSGYERVRELHREIDMVLPNKEWRAQEPKIIATTLSFLDVLQKPGTPDRAILDRLPAWARRQWQSTFDYFASLVNPEGIPDLFATLHPQWQEYVNFLAGVKGKSGREGGGYFSYEHGLWVGYMMWLLSKATYSGQEMVECIVAASLQRFDVREAYAKPDLDRTVAFIRSDEKLKAALHAMDVEPKVIALIVAGTAYPWDQARAQAWERELEDEIADEAQRAKIRHRAGLLRFINQVVTYAVNKPERTRDEVYELHRTDERAHQEWVKTFVSSRTDAIKASPAQIAESTMRFMDWVRSGESFGQHMQDLPAWMAGRWRDNHTYFLLEFHKHLYRDQGLLAGLSFSLRLALENKFDQAFGYASLPAQKIAQTCQRAFGPVWGPRVSVVVVRSALETLAFPLVAVFFGVPWWATIGFAAAHTLVAWGKRYQQHGMAGFTRGQILLDIKDFLIRAWLGGWFLSPFQAGSPAVAAITSFGYHGIYNTLALAFNRFIRPHLADTFARLGIGSRDIWERIWTAPVAAVGIETPANKPTGKISSADIEYNRALETKKVLVPMIAISLAFMLYSAIVSVKAYINEPSYWYGLSWIPIAAFLALLALHIRKYIYLRQDQIFEGANVRIYYWASNGQPAKNTLALTNENTLVLGGIRIKDGKRYIYGHCLAGTEQAIPISRIVDIKVLSKNQYSFDEPITPVPATEQVRFLREIRAIYNHLKILKFNPECPDWILVGPGHEMQWKQSSAYPHLIGSREIEAHLLLQGYNVRVFEPDADKNRLWRNTFKRLKQYGHNGKLRVHAPKNSDFSLANLPERSADGLVIKSVQTQTDKISLETRRAIMLKAAASLKPGGILVLGYYRESFFKQNQNFIASNIASEEATGLLAEMNSQLQSEKDEKTEEAARREKETHEEMIRCLRDAGYRLELEGAVAEPDSLFSHNLEFYRVYPPEAKAGEELRVKAQALLDTYFPDGYAGVIPLNSKILALIREIEGLEKRLGYKSDDVRVLLPRTEDKSNREVWPYLRPLAGIHYVSLPDGWETLEEKIRLLGQSQERITLSIAGREAGGKTHLAGQIKKLGIAGLAPGQILLMDVDDLLGDDKELKIEQLKRDLKKADIKLVVLAEGGVGVDWESRIREWNADLGNVDIRLFKDAPDTVRWRRLTRRMETSTEPLEPGILHTIRSIVDRYGAMAEKARRADIVIYDPDEPLEPQNQELTVSGSGVKDEAGAAAAAAHAPVAVPAWEKICLQLLGPAWGRRVVLAVRFISTRYWVTMTAPAFERGDAEEPRIELEETAGINSSPAAIRRYIENKVSQTTVDQTAGLVRDFWKTALADPQNPVITSLESLASAGVKSRTLENLIDVLMALGVNVTNPWTAMYHLSDIVGYLSPALLGEDISRFKNLCRTREFHDVSALEEAGHVRIPGNLTDMTWPELLAADRKIKAEQEKLVLSKQPFDRIAGEIAGSSNQFVKKILMVFIEQIWRDLGVPGDSQALVFFRDCKTFASDLDLYYWGPEAEKVNLELTRLFFLLGFKRDLFSTFLLDREIEEGRIDFYAYAYFSTVECVEFNGASSAEFYQREIKSKLDAGKIWQEIHPYLCRQLAKWNGMSIEDDLPLTLDDIKKLQHRAILNLMYGLCCKFNIDFGLDNASMMRALQQFMPPAEIQTLQRALDMANHARNINQIVTRRRWEKIDSKTRNKIAEIMAAQGLPEFARKVRDRGAELETIRRKYFGLPDYRVTAYLPLKSDVRAVEAWQRVAAAYLRICKQNVGQKSEMANSSRKSAALTHGPARRMGEAEAKDLSRRMVDELKLRRLKDTEGQCVVEGSEYGYERQVMAKPGSRVEGVPGYSEVYIRVGFLFFIDPAAYALLSAELKAALGSNVVLVPELNERNASAEDRNFNVWSFATLLAMFKCDLSRTCSIECGAGDGMLSVAAYKLGAPLVQLVDMDDRLLARAKSILEANHLREGQNYHILKGDLKKPETIASNLLPTDLPAAVISNIGHWPHYYTVTNQDSMALLPYLKKVEYFIAGGYMLHPQANVLTANLNADLAHIRELGMQPGQDMIRIKDMPAASEVFTSAAAAWVARTMSTTQFPDTTSTRKEKLFEPQILAFVQPERPYTSRQIAEGLHLPLKDIQAALKKMVDAGTLEEPLVGIYVSRPIVQQSVAKIFNAAEDKNISITIEQATRTNADMYARIAGQLKRNLATLKGMLDGRDYSEENGEKAYLLTAGERNNLLASLSMKIPRLGKKDSPTGIMLHLLEENEKGITDTYQGIGSELFRTSIRFAISLGYITRDPSIHEAIYGPGQSGNSDWFNNEIVMHSYAITKKGTRFANNAQVGILTKDHQGFFVWQLTPKDLLKYYLRQTLRTSGPLNAEALWKTDNLQVAYTLEQVEAALAELTRGDKVRRSEAGQYSFVPNHVLTSPFKNHTLLNSVTTFIFVIIAAGMGLRVLIPASNAQSDWGVKAAGLTGIFSGLHLPNGLGIMNWLGLHPVLAGAAGLIGIVFLVLLLRARLIDRQVDRLNQKLDRLSVMVSDINTVEFTSELLRLLDDIMDLEFKLGMRSRGHSVSLQAELMPEPVTLYPYIKPNGKSRPVLPFTAGWQELGEKVKAVLENKQPAIMLVSGRMGSGKTYLTDRMKDEGIAGLAPEQIEILRIDDIMKAEDLDAEGINAKLHSSEHKLIVVEEGGMEYGTAAMLRWYGVALPDKLDLRVFARVNEKTRYERLFLRQGKNFQKLTPARFKLLDIMARYRDVDPQESGADLVISTEAEASELQRQLERLFAMSFGGYAALQEAEAGAAGIDRNRGSRGMLISGKIGELAIAVEDMEIELGRKSRQHKIILDQPGMLFGPVELYPYLPSQANGQAAVSLENAWQQIEKKIRKAGQAQSKVVVTVSGRLASGKTTLTARLQENGLADIRPEEICVIQASEVNPDNRDEKIKWLNEQLRRPDIKLIVVDEGYTFKDLAWLRDQGADLPEQAQVRIFTKVNEGLRWQRIFADQAHRSYYLGQIPIGYKILDLFQHYREIDPKEAAADIVVRTDEESHPENTGDRTTSGKLTQVAKRFRSFPLLAALLLLLVLPKGGAQPAARTKTKAGYIFADFSQYVAEGKVASGANIEILKTDGKTVPVIFTGMDAKTGLLRGYALDGKAYSIKSKNIKYIHVRSTNVLRADSPYGRLLQAEEQVQHLQKINGLLRHIGIKAGDRIASVGPGDEYWEKGRAGMASFIMDLNFETYWADQGAEVTVYETGQPNAQWQALAAAGLRGPGRLNIVPQGQADFSRAELRPGSIKAAVIKSVLSDGQIPDPVKKNIILKAGQGLQPGGHLIIGCYHAKHFGSPAVRNKAEAAAVQGIITEDELRMIRGITPDEKARAEFMLTEKYLDWLRNQGYQVNLVDQATEPGDYLSHDLYVYQIHPPKNTPAGPEVNRSGTAGAGPSASQAGNTDQINGHPYIRALLLRHGLESVADLRHQTPEQAVSRLTLRTAANTGRWRSHLAAIWGSSQIEADGPDTGRLNIQAPAAVWQSLVLPADYENLQDVVKFNERVILRSPWLDRLPWVRAGLLLLAAAALRITVWLLGRNDEKAAWLAEKQLALIIEHQTGKAYARSRRAAWLAQHGLDASGAALLHAGEAAGQPLPQGQTLADYLEKAESEIAVGPQEFIGLFAEWMQEFQALTGKRPDATVLDAEAVSAGLDAQPFWSAKSGFEKLQYIVAAIPGNLLGTFAGEFQGKAGEGIAQQGLQALAVQRLGRTKTNTTLAARRMPARQSKLQSMISLACPETAGRMQAEVEKALAVLAQDAYAQSSRGLQQRLRTLQQALTALQSAEAGQPVVLEAATGQILAAEMAVQHRKDQWVAMNAGLDFGQNIFVVSAPAMKTQRLTIGTASHDFALPILAEAPSEQTEAAEIVRQVQEGKLHVSIFNGLPAAAAPSGSNNLNPFQQAILAASKVMPAAMAVVIHSRVMHQQPAAYFTALQTAAQNWSATPLAQELFRSGSPLQAKYWQWAQTNPADRRAWNQAQGEFIRGMIRYMGKHAQAYSGARGNLENLRFFSFCMRHMKAVAVDDKLVVREYGKDSGNIMAVPVMLLGKGFRSQLGTLSDLLQTWGMELDPKVKSKYFRKSFNLSFGGAA